MDTSSPSPTAAVTTQRNTTHDGSAVVVCKPQPITVTRNFPVYSGTRLDYAMGFMAASIYSLAYYVVPGWLILSASMLAVQPMELSTWIVTTPIVVSAIIPPIPTKWLLRTRFFKAIPMYFNFREILETSPSDMLTLVKETPTLLCMHPHGVFSMTALCAAVSWSNTWWDPAYTPTAVANAILHFPLLKHVVGTLGITSASAGPLAKTLNSSRNRGAILYVGGTSELFLADPNHERLYLLQRKGFIRIALTQGAALVPGYLFGNTRVLKLLQWPILRWFSRKTGIAITYFYGRFWLPMPLPAPCMAVIGTAILLPKIENPTSQEIDFWHAKYVSEVQRIFNTYKSECPGYEDKVLELE